MAGLALAPVLAACGGGGGSGGPGRPAQGPAGRATSSDARLVVTTGNGLRLRPADSDRVTVGRDVEQHWTHRDGTWVLDLSCSEHHRDDGRCPRQPEVKVPSGASVTVSARNAGIDAAGVRGALDLSTVNGDVVVTGSGRGDAPARLKTRNGSVRTSALRASALHAGTVNGDVTLGCTTAPRRVTASTTNGSVDAVVPHDSPAYRVVATTDNGRPSTDLPSPDPSQGSSRGRTMTLTSVNGDVSASRA